MICLSPLFASARRLHASDSRRIHLGMEPQIGCRFLSISNQRTTEPTNTMNITRTLLTIAALVWATALPIQAQKVGPPPAEPNGLVVFLIDDQSGEELAAKHGIQPITTTDLEVLVNGVLQNRAPVRLMHQAVDEDATDNAVTKMEFRPYAGGSPPVAPAASLPLRQLAEAMKKWRHERAIWQQGMMSYRKEVIAQGEGFVQKVATTQLEVAQRFDRMLAERNGRDFNRSDIFGCVETANHLLTSGGRKVLILNSDCEDLPGKRAPKKKPLTPAELAPEIELIFVNTSLAPDRAPLFTGLKNPVRHANSMREAMEMVVSMFGGEDGKDAVIAGK